MSSYSRGGEVVIVCHLSSVASLYYTHHVFELTGHYYYLTIHMGYAQVMAVF